MKIPCEWGELLSPCNLGIESTIFVSSGGYFKALFIFIPMKLAYLQVAKHLNHVHSFLSWFVHSYCNLQLCIDLNRDDNCKHYC